MPDPHASAAIDVAEEVTPGPAAGTPRSRRRLVIVAIAALAVAAVAWWTTRPRIPDPLVAATSLASTLTADGLAAVTWDEPFDRDAVATLLGDLGPGDDGTWTPIEVTVVATRTTDDPLEAEADLTVSWQVDENRTWEQDVTATLLRDPDDSTWVPAWSPTVVHPDLQSGDVLAVRTTKAERGRILDARGRVLVGPVRVTEVGLHPARVQDLDGVITAIVGVLDDRLDVQLDPGSIRSDVEAADPDHFVPVITLRNEDYQQVEDVVFPLIGTTFRDAEQYLGPTSGFARHTLGSVGPVTAEQLESDPQRWSVGDLAGRSGLQAAQDPWLAGTNGWSIVATREGDNDPTLHEVAPIAGQDLAVTLRRRVQLVADQVLADVESPASLVAIDATTGAVVAMANSPTATFDIARTGQVAPGSVFKVVTTTALLAEGLQPDDIVGCPAQVTVGSRSISNAGGFALGEVPFADAFAQSCNTTFVQLGLGLDDDALAEAAATFGIGGEWEVGLPVSSGSVPVADGAFDLAQMAFGQGRVQVNPLVMATVMASLADGTTIASTLLADDVTTAGQRPPLPDRLSGTLATLTRRVVTDGSGSAVADVPGAPVHGKTGTADFVGQDGPGLHVWFAGWQGDLAFALVVTDVDSGSGGGTAAPLVADFLTRIQ